MIEFLVWFVACFISTFGVAYFYCKLTDVEIHFRLIPFLIFVIGVFLITIVKYLNILNVSVISYFIYFPILFYSLKKLKFGKLVFYILLIYIYGIFLDLISMLIVTLIHNFIYFDMYGYIAQVVLSLIIFIAFVIMANSKVIKNFTNNLFKKVKKISYFDFTLISFAIFVLLMSIVMLNNLSNLNMIILSIALVLILTLFFVLLIKVRINLAENEIFLELLKKNNDFYIKIEDENRIFKHNLMAKMLSIKSVSGKNSRQLIDDFLKSFNNNMDFSIQIQDMPYGLNGIIYEKIYPYLGKLHIKIDNKINFDIFTKLKPRRYNVFVEKMIISLDNAIESSMKSVDKILVINLYFEGDNIILDIKNTFSSSLNLDELGQINYSTKGRRRGLGLFSALRDNEVNLSIKIVNNLFVSKIVAKQNLNAEE